MKQPAGRMPGKILPVSPVIVLVALALAVAATGSVTLPLDGHEVLVVGTTQEMQQRGDWVVPYFNGEPRLTKPPLSYWLTGVTAWLSGSLDSIQAWHARVPSILAGVGLVLLTWLTGTRLFGAATGITAGLLLLSSVAFFSYSHDGRPDMVYALCCMGGLTCFVFAQTTVSPPSGGWIYLMWLSYGLATLAKGPQLPLCMLFACLLYLRFSGCGWRQGAAQLRIFAGSALAVAIVLPWWRLLRNSVPSAALDMSQLSGTLLIPRWQDAFDLYYFYQPLILILPWLALLPATLARLWRRSAKQGRRAAVGTAVVNTGGRTEFRDAKTVVLHAAASADDVFAVGTGGPVAACPLPAPADAVAALLLAGAYGVGRVDRCWFADHACGQCRELDGSGRAVTHEFGHCARSFSGPADQAVEEGAAGSLE